MRQRRQRSLILSIPSLLILLHYGVVPATRNQSVFDHDQIALVDLYAANFLYLNDSHLRSKLLGYATVVTPA